MNFIFPFDAAGSYTVFPQFVISYKFSLKLYKTTQTEVADDILIFALTEIRDRNTERVAPPCTP